MRTNTLSHVYHPRTGDTWCRTCNCTKVEHQTLEFLDSVILDDYLSSHGEATIIQLDELPLALDLWAAGDDYATIAHEILFRRL